MSSTSSLGDKDSEDNEESGAGSVEDNPSEQHKDMEKNTNEELDDGSPDNRIEQNNPFNLVEEDVKDEDQRVEAEYGEETNDDKDAVGQAQVDAQQVLEDVQHDEGSSNPKADSVKKSHLEGTSNHVGQGLPRQEDPGDQKEPEHAERLQPAPAAPVPAPAPPIKHVKIHENIEIHEASDTNSESDRWLESDSSGNSGNGSNADKAGNDSKRQRRITNGHHSGFGSRLHTGGREIIGILKHHRIKDSRSFPSLPDKLLSDLGLLEGAVVSTEHLSPQDIEAKFSSLSLAFKTDRVTLPDRLELQKRQRDLAERNVADEIQQLKITLKSLHRICQDSETREILERCSKQVTVLQQSSCRVASSSEQFGAVQQEMRVSSAVEIMLLHLENLKRSYEREHTELEETKRILVQHKIIEGDSKGSSGSASSAERGQGGSRLDRGGRNRSISVIQGSTLSVSPKVRRSSVQSPVSGNAGQANEQPASSRQKTSTLLQLVSGGGRVPGTYKDDLSNAEKIQNDNNNNSKENLNHNRPIGAVSAITTAATASTGAASTVGQPGVGQTAMVTTASYLLGGVTSLSGGSGRASLSGVVGGKMPNSGDIFERRRESRRQSQFATTDAMDMDTIIEEIDELASRRDSTNTQPSASSQVENDVNRPLIMPKSARELMQRKKSLLLHIQDWYSELTWPYDEEETILGFRYLISGILSVTALAILLGTFLR